mmetsp:Transcript_23090/g.78016  ORF Transcript_23090/g.78016 Transcript_23090/m.78016 type:complete len:271 (-) Transcript_23090:4193-5005(-)
MDLGRRGRRALRSVVRRRRRVFRPAAVSRGGRGTCPHRGSPQKVRFCVEGHGRKRRGDEDGRGRLRDSVQLRPRRRPDVPRREQRHRLQPLRRLAAHGDRRGGGGGRGVGGGSAPARRRARRRYSEVDAWKVPHHRGPALLERPRPAAPLQVRAFRLVSLVDPRKRLDVCVRPGVGLLPPRRGAGGPDVPRLQAFRQVLRLERFTFWPARRLLRVHAFDERARALPWPADSRVPRRLLLRQRGPRPGYRRAGVPRLRIARVPAQRAQVCF